MLRLFSRTQRQVHTKAAKTLVLWRCMGMQVLKDSRKVFLLEWRDGLCLGYAHEILATPEVT